jgi:tRNA dimethylallyltransferase
MIKPKIILVTGPTAVGKTRIAHLLAREFSGEIINADSLQVYRYLDIGTAKPSAAEREGIPYHLIDIRQPDESFDAADFYDLAQGVIEGLDRKGRVAFLVGGTGLYLRVLRRGLFPCPKPDPEIRARWTLMAEREGDEALWRVLREKDPTAADRLHPRDRVRLIRALEVLELTGRPLSQWQQWGRSTVDSPYDCLGIALRRERPGLYEAINRRTEIMIRQGFLQEVEGLLARGYGPELRPLKALGYRHLIKVVQGEWELDQALELLKRDTRRYAKRQLTWLSKEPDLNWFFPEEFDTIRERVKEFLEG